MSSDSESSLDTKPAKKDKTTKRELSASEDLDADSYQKKDLDAEDKKEDDDILLDHDGESPTKKLVKEEEKSLEKKNVNNSTKGGKEPQIGFQYLGQHPE